jgi:hypothetical protein
MGSDVKTDWVLVPREPTREMLAAGGFIEIPKRFLNGMEKAAAGTDGATIVYAAMLSAAPSPSPSADLDDLVKRLQKAAEYSCDQECEGRCEVCPRTAEIEAITALTALQARVGEMEKDAASWRALTGCGHLRMMGWAGFDKDGNPAKEHLHFGMEAWSHPHANLDEAHEKMCKAQRDQAMKILTGFVATTSEEPK